MGGSADCPSTDACITGSGQNKAGLSFMSSHLLEVLSNTKDYNQTQPCQLPGQPPLPDFSHLQNTDGPEATAPLTWAQHLREQKYSASIECRQTFKPRRLCWQPALLIIARVAAIGPEALPSWAAPLLSWPFKLAAALEVESEDRLVPRPCFSLALALEEPRCPHLDMVSLSFRIHPKGCWRLA